MRKKIHIRQNDSYDCGAASLTSVAAWWGLRLPLSQVRRECGCSSEGITIRGIVDGAQSIGLSAKPLKAEGADNMGVEEKIARLRTLNQAGAPVIAHTVSEEGMLHYVVIYNVGKNSVEVMDPAKERIGRVNIADFAGRWSGYIVLLCPGGGYRAEDRTTGRNTRLLRLLEMHRREIILALAGSIVLTALGICNSLLLQMLIDKAIPSGNFSAVALIAGIILAMIPLSLMIGYLRDLYLIQGGVSVDTSMVIGFMRRIFKMDEKFFCDYPKGELESRLSDTGKIRMFICGGVVSVCVCTVTLIGVCALMFTFYSRLAAILMACIPVYVALLWAADRINRRMSRKVMAAAAEFENDVMDSIEGEAAIRHFGVETESLSFNSSFSRLAFWNFRAGKLAALLAGLGNALNQLILGAVLIIGGSAVIAGKMTLGELVSFWTLSAFFISPTSTLVQFDSLLNEALTASERVYGITDFKEIQEDGSRASLTVLKGEPMDLEFRDVCFRYRGGRSLIEGLNCTFPKGCITGILGPNGCGKSTVASLILRDYIPDSGSIAYGGIDIKNILFTCWRSIVSSIPQHSHIFSATIFDNIAMSPGRRDGHIDEKEVKLVMESCRRAGMEPLIRRLDKGLLSHLGKGGLRLSSGERQMVLTARMLHSNSDIMIFDEAASNMDEESVASSIKLMQDLKESGKCVIVITHDSRIASCCDNRIELTGRS